MRKIRKGDEIIVIAGKDKGKIGVVLSVVKDGAKVVVEGVNVARKHVKPNPAKQTTGGIESKTMPIDISNVAIYNNETKKADRVGFELVDGKRIRIYKSTKKAVELRS
jgi:large subunit ribosomal protein L24